MTMNLLLIAALACGSLLAEEKPVVTDKDSIEWKDILLDLAAADANVAAAKEALHASEAKRTEAQNAAQERYVKLVERKAKDGCTVERVKNDIACKKPEPPAKK